MYTITFYSFKGGVGRTMALVNVAMELLKNGKSVLLVDFDLEAPGLDAFPLLKPRDEVPGIVEYVADYLKAGAAPPVRDYISSYPQIEGTSGTLWIMRSGIQDRTYSARLHAIDWQRLYTEQDGFLLLEDLKAQWEAELKPDYVLIDSRTGHTDVGGICTRQLPDAVVLCFVPNEENVRGLETIVKDIQREGELPFKDRISLFFIPSNVPRLDDEQYILARRLKVAERQLGFEEPSCIIHRYDSLSLLDNVIFTIKRPDSRLARQFRVLTKVITQDNLQDRNVALRFLTSDNWFRTMKGQASLERKLNDLRTNHARDGEVLHALALFTRRLGREEEAKALLSEADALGFRIAETMLDGAHRLCSDGRYDLALELVLEAIGHPRATYFDLNRAIRLILQIDVKSLECFKRSTAMQSLHPSQQASLCEEMFASRTALPFAEDVVRYFSASTSRTERFQNSLMICLIGQRKFVEAMHYLSDTRPEPQRLGTVDGFNYAMAEWGSTGRIPIDLFRRVAELNTDTETRHSGKNVYQCLAIAHWSSGNLDLARKFVSMAEQAASADASETFSGWRYLLVTPEQFVTDLACVRRMIEGADILPIVFRADDEPPTVKPKKGE